jgi:hypothetical protein
MGPWIWYGVAKKRAKIAPAMSVVGAIAGNDAGQSVVQASTKMARGETAKKADRVMADPPSMALIQAAGNSSGKNSRVDRLENDDYMDQALSHRLCRCSLTNSIVLFNSSQWQFTL